MEKIAFIAGFVALTCLVSLVFSFPMMLLWNWCLVPAASSVVTEVSWLQMWGISVLFSMLFKPNVTSK